MTRRTLFHWLAGWRGGSATLGAHARVGPDGRFSGGIWALLREIAAIVLPTSAGPAAAGRFEKWVREYQPGADLDHGYGNTRVRSKAPSPAPVYLGQLSALQGKVTRQSIQAQLAEAKVDSLPRSPDGRSIVADLMAFYFNSSDALDLCYQLWATQPRVAASTAGISSPGV